jgi:hypothetical protein
VQQRVIASLLGTEARQALSVEFDSVTTSELAHLGGIEVGGLHRGGQLVN